MTILACMCQKYNNNSNNGNALNQVVTLQFSMSSVPFLPSLCWSWRPRQGRYSAGCFLSWKELNIQPAMLLLQCWKVTLSRLRGVTGATSLSDLNTEQCFYLERKKKGETKAMYVESASTGQKGISAQLHLWHLLQSI